MTLLAAFLRSVRILKQIGINVRLENKKKLKFFQQISINIFKFMI